MGHTKLNIQDVEGAGPGGAFHFVRRELGVLAFGVNWIELPPDTTGHEHGIMDMRWVRAETHPVASTRVVPLADNVRER